MTTTNTNPDAAKEKEDLLGHLPAELLEKIRSRVALEDVQAHARHDLDENGMYFDGHLVLTEGELGHFRHVDGQWQGQWMPVAGIAGARIVEGLSMNLLRLVSDKKVLAEYRFTLRHAKEVARLQRRL